MMTGPRHAPFASLPPWLSATWARLPQWREAPTAGGLMMSPGPRDATALAPSSRVAIRATGTHLGAAGPRVEGVIGPLNLAVLTHETALVGRTASAAVRSAISLRQSESAMCSGSPGGFTSPKASL